MFLFIIVIVLIAVIMWYLRKQSMSGGRDYGNDSERDIMPYYSNNKKDDTPTVLKESSNGYMKTAVLLKLDAYNAFMVSIEDGNMSRSDALEKYNTVKNLPMSKAKFGQKGFDIQDVNIYIAELETKIEEKINELR